LRTNEKSGNKCEESLNLYRVLLLTGVSEYIKIIMLMIIGKRFPFAY